MEVIAATTDVAVTLVWLGAVVLVGCLFGWLGEKFLLRHDRRRGVA